jgi:hypothetical protein
MIIPYGKLGIYVLKYKEEDLILDMKFSGIIIVNRFLNLYYWREVYLNYIFILYIYLFKPFTILKHASKIKDVYGS